MAVPPPCLLLDFSDQAGWGNPLGSEVLRLVLSEAARFCLPQGEPLALWQPVPGAPATIACEMPGWGPQVAAEYLRQILQRFEATDGGTGAAGGTMASPRVVGGLALGTLQPAAAPEERADIERALAWLRSSRLRGFVSARDKRTTRVATGLFLQHLRADRSRELLFPADAHAERWHELTSGLLEPARETTPPGERVAVDAADWKIPPTTSDAGATRVVRIGVLLGAGHGPEGTGLPAGASELLAALSKAGVASRLRVEWATVAGLTRLSRAGCDLLIWVGDSLSTGRFRGRSGLIRGAEWACDPTLVPLWRELRGCVVLGAHADRFAQELPTPWLATTHPESLETPRAVVQSLLTGLKGSSWSDWSTRVSQATGFTHGGGDWKKSRGANSRFPAGATRLELATPEWLGKVSGEWVPDRVANAALGRDALLRRLERALHAPLPSVTWVHADPGQGVSALLERHAQQVATESICDEGAPTWVLHMDCRGATTAEDFEQGLWTRAASLYQWQLASGATPATLTAWLSRLDELPGRHLWVLDHLFQPLSGSGDSGGGDPVAVIERLQAEARRLGTPLRLVVGARQPGPPEFDPVGLAPLATGDWAELFPTLVRDQASPPPPGWSELNQSVRSGLTTASLRRQLQWRAWSGAGPAPEPGTEGGATTVSDEAARRIGIDLAGWQQVVWPVVRRAGAFSAQELAEWLGRGCLGTAEGGATDPGEAWSQGLENLADLGWLSRCQRGDAVAYTLPPHLVPAAVRSAGTEPTVTRPIPLRAAAQAWAQLVPLLNRPDPAVVAQLDLLAGECRRETEAPGAVATLARVLRWLAVWSATQPDGGARARAANDELLGLLERPEAAVLQPVSGAVLDQARDWTAAGETERARELLSRFLSRLEGRTEPSLMPALAELSAELGAVLVDLQRPAEALPLLERGLAYGPAVTAGAPAPGQRRAELARGLALVGVERAREGRQALADWLQTTARETPPPSDDWFTAAQAGLAAACTWLGEEAAAVGHHRLVAERLTGSRDPRLVARGADALQAQANLVEGQQPGETVSLLKTWLERYRTQGWPGVRQRLPEILLTLQRAAVSAGDGSARDLACDQLLAASPAGTPAQVAETATALSGWVTDLIARKESEQPAGWSGRVRDWFERQTGVPASTGTATRFAIAEWLSTRAPAAEALAAWEELLASPPLQPAVALPVELARARLGRAVALEAGDQPAAAQTTLASVVDLLTPESPPALVELVATALAHQTRLLERPENSPGALRAHHEQVLARLESRPEPGFSRAIAQALYQLGRRGPDGVVDATAHDRLIDRFLEDPRDDVRGDVLSAVVLRAEAALERGELAAAVAAASQATSRVETLTGDRAAELARRAWLVLTAAHARQGDLSGQLAAVRELTRWSAAAHEPQVLLPVRQAQVTLAQTLVAAGHTADAVGLLDSLLAPDTPPTGTSLDEWTTTAWLERGLARLSLGDLGPAQIDLEQAAMRARQLPQPQSAEPLARTLHAQASLRLHQGDLAGEARVRTELEESVTTNSPASVARWAALALVQSAEAREKVGQRAEAAELLERVIARSAATEDPQLLEPLSRALLARGFGQLRVGNLPAALESARQVQTRFAQQSDPQLQEAVRRAEGLARRVEQILQAVQAESDGLITPEGGALAAPAPAAPVPPAAPPAPTPPVSKSRVPTVSRPAASGPGDAPTPPPSGANPPAPRVTGEVAIPPTESAATPGVGAAQAPPAEPPQTKRNPPKKGAKGAGAAPVQAAAENREGTSSAVPETPSTPAGVQPPLAAGLPPVSGGDTSAGLADKAVPAGPAGANGAETAPSAPPAVEAAAATLIEIPSPGGSKPAGPTAGGPVAGEEFATEETDEFDAYTSRGGAAAQKLAGRSGGKPRPGGGEVRPALTVAEARSLLDDTRLLREAGDRQEALHRYARVCRQFDRDSTSDGLQLFATAQLGMATTQHQAGERETALSICEAVHQRFAQHPDPLVAAQALEAQLTRAGFLHDAQLSEAEMQVLDAAIREFGDRTEPALAERVARGLMTKGGLQGTLGDLTGAVATFNDLVQRYRGVTDVAVAEQVARALAARAVRQSQLRDVAGHLASLEEVLQLFGDRTEPGFASPQAYALFSKAVRVAQSGDVAGSLALYDQVITRFRDQPSPELDELVAKSLFYKAVRLPPAEGIPCYAELVTKFGEHADSVMVQLCVTALVNQGVLLGQLGRLDEELAAYDEAVRRYGDRREPTIARQAAKALVSKGNSLRRAQRLVDAIFAFDTLLERFMGRSEPAIAEQLIRGLLGKASSQGEMGAEQEALQTYDSVLPRFGTETDKTVRAMVAVVVLQKGVTLESLQQSEAAVTWLKKHAGRLVDLPEQYARGWDALKKKLKL